MDIKKLLELLLKRIFASVIYLLGIIITPIFLMFMYGVFKEVILVAFHYIEAIFVKRVGDYKLEWFPYLRINLKIPNDYNYQDWLYGSIKFINDNLDSINNFANDFQGGFLTRSIVLGVFMLPITLSSAVFLIIQMFRGELDDL